MLDVNINSLQIIHIVATQSIKNGSNRFVTGLSRVCHANYSFKEVNDINDFEASKLGGTIEWE